MNLVVGQASEALHFSVHKSVLSQSPVLAQFCLNAPHFAEGHASAMPFPEDPPTAFGLMIEYLYTLEYSPVLADQPDYWEPSTTMTHWVSEQAAMSAQLYALAEKYQLTQLQPLITEKLFRLRHAMSTKLFFDTSKAIYESVPEERLTTSFFGFFDEEASARMVSAAVYDDWFLSYFEEGGTFGKDLARILIRSSQPRSPRRHPPIDYSRGGREADKRKRGRLTVEDDDY